MRKEEKVKEIEIMNDFIDDLSLRAEYEKYKAVHEDEEEEIDSNS